MTFANRNEQWKHDKDGLEIIKEIPALADKAFKDIDPAMSSASSGRVSTRSGRATATSSCASSCRRAS